MARPPISRRTFIKGAAAAAALSAVGGGWVLSRRRARRRATTPAILSTWPALGAEDHWLRPDLQGVPVTVPDRPHWKEETLDPALRARLRRVRTFHLTTGHQRLRGGDPRKDGTRRILAVGDSVTVGWGVEDHETWPHRLERLLQARAPAQVLNASSPGLPTATMQRFLERVAPGLEPDVVLVSMRPRGPEGAAGHARAVAAARAALPGASFRVLLPPVSRFDRHGGAVWAEEAESLRRALPGVPVLELTPVFRAAQGQAGCDLRERDGRLQVVRLETGQVLLEVAAPGEGLPREVLDLFEDDPSVREALFFDDGHPDADGQALLARAALDLV